MSNQVFDEINKKIVRERNMISAFTNMKQKTNNPEVIHKCNSNIQEAQQNIDYLNQRLSELKLHQATSTNSDDSTISSDLLKKAPASSESKYLRLDLMKYDCPSLGQRIHYMINQLDTKIKLEQKYYEANEKLSKIYQLDGDRRISSVAEDGRIQSNHKIQLLKKSLKRYEDINVSLDQIVQEDNPLNNVKFRNSTPAGILTIGINSVRDVDHIASPLFSRKTESYISVKIDDEEKARTKGSRTDRWSEELKIHVDKGNEIELTIYDKISGSYVPVAIGWFLISDIAEEIRRKKVGRSGVGWVSASRIQSGTGPQAQNTADNLISNERESTESSRDVFVTSSWFVLQPAGQILLTFGFTKTSAPNKKTLLGGLHRHGAIRKRDEEVFEQHGHQFVQKQFYNIMRCALCGEFLPYNGYQCQDCKFLCHKRCYEKVITKCISKSSTDTDPDELKLNHRIPHRFENHSNRGTNWCCHCGYLLPWGRKNILKCSECETMCHPQCSHLVPDFCGMSMETANEILKTIKSTEGTRKKRIQDFNKRQSATSSATIVADSTEISDSRLDTKFNKPIQSNKPTLAPAPIKKDRFVYPTNLPTESLNKQQEPVYHQQILPTQQKELLNEREQAEQTHNKISRESRSKYDTSQDAVSFKPQVYTPNQQLDMHTLDHDLSFQPDHDEPYENGATSSVGDILTSAISSKAPESTPSSRYETFPQAPINTESLGISETPVPTPPPHTNSRAPTQVQKKRRANVGLDDFNFITVLGRGNFGKVMLGRSSHTNQLCAVKILKKDIIIENNEIASLQAEKEVFLIANRESHPFLTNLHCCFQTANRIYFVMEYISGGDLMWHVQQGNFSMRRAKFYAAEILLALKFLHENGIVYRDLKLDNIMLNTKGHIKLADYGLCKNDMWYGKSTNTFCGTPEFMAPEILKEESYTRSVDWWAYGVLVYQMLLGKSPFRGEDEDEVFNAILTDDPLFPIQMASEAVDLLQSLLEKDPTSRLGSGPRDAEEIMVHSYFKNIDFDDILNLRVTPPYVPQVQSEEDTSFFDKDFTNEVPKLTPVNSILDSASQGQFRGFSYVNDNAGL